MAGPGRRGRAPLPTELKRRRGNPGKRRLPSANVIALAPVMSGPPVQPVDGDGLIQALLDSPASAWIAEPDRLALLTLVRDAWDERAMLREDIARNGYGEGRYTRPAVMRLREVERSLTLWLSLLGLTPADRTRLGVAEVKARTRLEELRARREEKRARIHAG